MKFHHSSALPWIANLFAISLCASLSIVVQTLTTPPINTAREHQSWWQLDVDRLLQISSEELTIDVERKIWFWCALPHNSTASQSFLKGSLTAQSAPLGIVLSKILKSFMCFWSHYHYIRFFKNTNNTLLLITPLLMQKIPKLDIYLKVNFEDVSKYYPK